MKKIFTLLVVAFFAIAANSQVVFNEVYTDPGSGNNEFFEFYNTSTNPVPENMDGYTIVAYYEESGKSGFYILDLPNQTVGPKGYYVGASANPFNVQGQNNVAANFSWNAMPSGGAVRKMEKSGSAYISVPFSSPLNDFFVKRSGIGASHHIFVFKNGILVNGLFGGSSSATIPTYIKAMPPLFVDMTGTSIDFVIDFTSFNNNQFEYTTAVTGSDNGFYRTSDGKCGVWDKSTAASKHTPGNTNGSASGLTGDLTITYYITEVGGDYTKALLVYNVTAASLAAFPATIETYEDRGIIGQLDALDVLLDSRQISTLTAGDQYVVLPNRTAPVMLVAKTPSGCFDQLRAIPNSLSPLPVNLLSFQGNLNKNNKVTLNWTVADNETVNYFEIEKSLNGRDFEAVGTVFASEKRGTEKYMFYETVTNNDKVFYRLKMIDKENDIDYSRVLVFMLKSINTTDIKVIGNPVKDKLTFTYTSYETKAVDVKVFDMSGRLVMNNKVNSYEGSNTISLPLNSTLKTGMYVVEVSNGVDVKTAKFIKQ